MLSESALQTPSRFLLTAAGLALTLIALGPASAQELTGNIHVEMTLRSTCSINGQFEDGAQFGVINFGEHPTSFQEVGTLAVNGDGAIRILCSRGVSPSYQINGGQHAGQVDDHNHAMVHDGGTLLPYDVYSDEALNEKIMPDMPYELPAFDGVTDQNLILYAVAYGQPGLTPGTYTDNLMVQINF